jgi:hypothetical protein
MKGIIVHGDYLELTGVDQRTDILAVLIQLLNPLALYGGSRTFPVLTLPGNAQVFVDEIGDGHTRLAIATSGPDPAQRRISAARVYNILLDHTEWALSWTADDVTAVIASRSAAPHSDRRQVAAASRAPHSDRHTPDPAHRRRRGASSASPLTNRRARHLTIDQLQM